MTESYGSTGPTEPYTPLPTDSQGTSSPAHAADTPTRQSAWGDTAASGTPVSSQATTSDSSGGGMKDKASAAGSTAKEGAGRVIDAEKQMAHDTAHEAKNVAKDTVAEARTQAKDLFAQTRDEVSRTAGEQLQRLSGTTSSLSSEFGKMASSSEEGGLAASLVEQASSYLDRATQWVEGREPGDLLTDVKHYARRHPGTFMAVAAGLGLVAGRIARGAKDEHGDDSTHAPHAAPASTTARPSAYDPAPAGTTGAGTTGYGTTPTTGTTSTPDGSQSTAYRSPGYGEPGYQRPGGDSL